MEEQRTSQNRKTELIETNTLLRTFDAKNSYPRAKAGNDCLS